MTARPVRRGASSCNYDADRRSGARILRRGSRRGEQVYYRIRLTNARISNIRQFVKNPDVAPTTATPVRSQACKDQCQLEEVSLVFERIQVEATLGGTKATDGGVGAVMR